MRANLLVGIGVVASVADIQAATAEVKRAEDALKLAKQKRKALLAPAK